MGAPKGGRVHWLLLHLRKDFKRSYQCYYNYTWHRYSFIRYERKKLYDIFIVIRTSRDCWKCTYFNRETLDFETFSTRKSKHMALRMWLIYQRNQP